MQNRFLLALSACLVATPALAHPGEHGRMSAVEVIQHYAEPDHLAFLALTVLVGWLGYRYGRRVEARAAARVRTSGKDRTR
ncbi:MAG: hypothetical protein ACKVP7_22465 [Hyphomicrobiaceae bacterium]